MTDPLHGKGPVFKLFVEVAKLPREQRKAELMPRLEHLWETAMGRTYEAKRKDKPKAGEPLTILVGNPDVATALRVVEVADALLCEAGEGEAKAGKLAGLGVFRKAG